MRKFDDGFEDDPITGETIWPEEILVKARKAVAAYDYAGAGSEELVLSGKVDHWHAIQVACYAVSGRKPETPKQAIAKIPARDRRVDLENKIWLIEQEIKERQMERDREMKQRMDHIHRTLDAKMKRIFLK